MRVGSTFHQCTIFPSVEHSDEPVLLKRTKVKIALLIQPSTYQAFIQTLENEGGNIERQKRVLNSMRLYLLIQEVEV